MLYFNIWLYLLLDVEDPWYKYFLSNHRLNLLEFTSKDKLPHLDTVKINRSYNPLPINTVQTYSAFNPLSRTLDSDRNIIAFALLIFVCITMTTWIRKDRDFSSPSPPSSTIDTGTNGFPVHLLENWMPKI